MEKKKNLGSSISLVIRISLSNDLGEQLSCVCGCAFLVGAEITGIAFWMFIIRAYQIARGWTCLFPGRTQHSRWARSCEGCALTRHAKITQRIGVTFTDSCSRRQLIIVHVLLSSRRTMCYTCRFGHVLISSLV